MKRSLVRSATHSRGSALLIVLAFLLLLTTLTVAFLSRATFERQLSNASFSQGKIDLAGQGAIAAIVGDLQQEIVAGSNGNGSTIVAGTTIPAVGTGFLYPNSPTTVIPALVVPGYTPSTIVGTGIENLVKISKNGNAFYSGSNYNTTTYSAPSRAAPVSTGTASLNGRLVTNARWNKPVLMNPTDTSFDPPAAFTTPDWIYVARDGSNPGNGSSPAWDSSYIYSASVSPTQTPATPGSQGYNPITQRYAYAIYDEGSTLDLNVAGSPFISTTSPYYSSNQPYKNALAYADLTQLPYSGPGTAAISSLGGGKSQAFVNAIVGWRNYATSLLANTSVFPNTYSFAAANSAAFDQNIIFNPVGFMSVNGPASTTSGNGPQKGINMKGTANQTDNAFGSRQQLLQFVLQGLAQNGTFQTNTGLSPSNLASLLPYLGTFSRDISQPSFAPNPSRPTIVGTAASGGNDGSGGDATINPPFLSVTVGASFIRNDGTTALVGEPLVKKRFALNRLAWITYLGPVTSTTSPRTGTSLTAPSSTSQGTDYDIWQLENTYNIPVSFLKQGTAANIQNYFGLVWNSSGYWTYTPASGASTSILTLSAVAALNREPNFIELLKATILAGSVGKDFPSDISDTLQNNVYTSLDCSVLQIAANIIDQATCDGYPTQIQFTSSGGHTYQIYGVKNLPYFYRVRTATLTTTLPTASGTGTNNGGTSQTINLPSSGPISSTDYFSNWTGTVSNAGQFALVQEPEIWNPHGWNPNDTTSYGMGNPRPTSFQLVATSPASSAFSIQPISGFPFTGQTDSNPLDLTSGIINATLTFNVPATGQGAGLFREPTLLITPNVPNGSSLAGTTGSSALSVFGTPYAYSYWFSNSAYYSASFLPNGVTAANGTTVGSGNSGSQPFLGFVVSSQIPVLWTPSAPLKNASSSSPVSLSSKTLMIANCANISNASGVEVNYVLACNQPGSTTSWISYDTKIGNTVTADGMYARSDGQVETSMLDYANTANVASYTDEMIPILNIFGAFDPRTGRFGLVNGTVNLQQGGAQIYMHMPHYSLYGEATRWICPEQNMLESDRPDSGAGYGYGNGNITPGGTYPPNNSDGWSWGINGSGTLGPQLYPGLFQQNNMNYKDYDSSYEWSLQDETPPYSNSPQYYADSDNVVRRGEGGYVLPVLPQVLSGGATGGVFSLGSTGTASAVTSIGLPMATAHAYSSTAVASQLPVNTTAVQGSTTQSNNTITTSTLSANSQPYTDVPPFMVGNPSLSLPSNGTYMSAHPSGMAINTPHVDTGVVYSRPIVLNRPFRTVGEMGCVFSGTPWKNLDLMSQESGCTGLLDVFCINDTNDPGGLVAGKINLNTRQAPVLQAVIAGAYIDNYSNSILNGLSSNFSSNGTLTSSASASLATALVNRTTGVTSGGAPLVNPSELVGKSLFSPSIPAPSTAIDGSPNGSSNYFAGFSTDMTSIFAPSSSSTPDYYMNNIERFRESPMRALSAAGTTRVWNLMIDVIAQTGRFPASAASATTPLAAFNVEGERRYWVHVAIDRYTGKVLDEQVEEVKE